MAKRSESHPLYSRYHATDDGCVWNSKRMTKLAGCQGETHGYRMVGLGTESGCRKLCLVHRIVYECFHGVLPAGLQVDHVDGNRYNNALSNLQALTTKQHAHKTALDNPNRGRKAGLRSSKPVIAVHRYDGTMTLYPSLTAASTATGAHIGHLWSCLNGRRKYAADHAFNYAVTVDNGTPQARERNDDEVWVCHLASRTEVSSMGRVRSRRGIVSNGSLHQGYMRTKGLYVHRLVCEAFQGPPPDGEHTVDHIDRNKLNNQACNLRWASRKQQNSNRRPQIKTASPHLSVTFPQWMARVSDFAAQHGRIPSFHEQLDGFKIGHWVNNRRQDYKRGRLQAEHIRLLEHLPGWRWQGRRATSCTSLV